MIINPHKLDIPTFVLVDDRRSFIGFAIKNHSHGCYFTEK